MLPHLLNRKDKRTTVLVDTGTRGIYCRPDTPIRNTNKSAQQIRARTVSGDLYVSSVAYEPDIPNASDYVSLEGHLMPEFANNLVDIGRFCDEGCNITYTTNDVTIFDLNGKPIVRGWRENPIFKLRRMSCVLEDNEFVAKPGGTLVFLVAFNAYEFPWMEALVRFLHTAADYPVGDMWLKADKKGLFDYWPRLT